MKTRVLSKAQVLDTRYLTITDFSVYNTELPVTNTLYRITLVNFNQYVDIPYVPNTAMNINSNLLKLTAGAYDDLCEIPSGLLHISQSVCPNDKLLFEYHFLNIAPELKKIADSVCCYKEDPDKLDKLWDLKQSLEVAKSLAEN